MTRQHKKARKTQGAPRPAEARLRRRLAAAQAALERIRKGEAPSPTDLAGAPLLEGWCVVVDTPFPVLQGVVTHHPRLPDGHMIATSPLLWLAPDQTAARTVSRWYRLGVPLIGAAPTRH